MVLDKGQREDWFESRFIVVAAVIAVAGVLGAVLWEWRSKHPLVDLHLLKERNFAIAVMIMFSLGFVLYGSTMLLPLMLQTLMGYTATSAGMVLSPGGMVTMAMMPVIGFLVGRYQARYLVMVGLAAVAGSMFYMAHFSLGIDFKTAMLARMIMGFGLAFMFVPINTAAYFYLPRDKNNNASGLINLSRNLGGSFGIAFATTMLARGEQIHHNMLVGHLSEYNPAYRAMLASARQAVGVHTADPVQATAQAQALLYSMMQKQAAMLSFLDDYRVMGVVFLAMIPLVFMMKRARPKAGGMAVH